MSYTLLELVQTIASSMDSDEITSIVDSVESMQIATVVRTAYNDLISRLDLPEHSTLFNLTASGTATKPVLMFVPSDIKTIRWVQYDAQTADNTDVNYQDVKYLELKSFLDMVNSLDVGADEVDSMSHDTFTFLFNNNRAPMFYTTYDDHTIIFDSYDSDVDTTLQASKTRCYGNTIVTWEMSDAFVPNLDEAQFALLLNEAKSLAWTELKQSQHPKAEQSARRQWVKSQKSKSNFNALKELDKLVNFGRK